MTTTDGKERASFPSGYGIEQVSRMLGIGVSQIRSFVEESFLEPRIAPGGELRFSFQDLVLLRSAKELTSELSPLKVRRALRHLKAQLPKGRELAALRILREGDAIVARDGDAAWEPESRQTHLNFDVSEIATVVEPFVRKAADDARNAEQDVTAEDWYELGCELETCDVNQARDAYRRTLELEPLHPDAHVNLGRLLHESGELRAAEGHYRLALQARGNDATAAFNLGVSLQDLGRTRDAIDAYGEAIAIDPSCADAHYNLANLYESLGRPHMALKHLQSYQRLTRAAPGIE